MFEDSGSMYTKDKFIGITEGPSDVLKYNLLPGTLNVHLIIRTTKDQQFGGVKATFSNGFFTDAT